MMTKLDGPKFIAELAELRIALTKERERAKAECHSIDFRINLSEYRWWTGYAIGLDYAIRELKDIGELK